MGTYSIQHLSAQLNEVDYFYVLTVVCMISISPKEFIDFFEFKLIDNFNISKISAKFEHQFIAVF